MYLFTYFFFVFLYFKFYYMKTITVSEFRKDIKKYCDIAQEEQVLVNRGSGDAFYIVPAAKVKQEYSKEFMQKISKAEKQIKDGKSIRVKGAAEIKALLKKL